MIENCLIKKSYYDFLEKYTDETKADTNRERKHAVDQFVAFLEIEVVNISELNSQTMFDYISFLFNCKTRSNKKYAANTINQRFALVCTFLKFCFEQKYLDEHKDRIVTSFVKTKLPTATRKIKEYITFKEMKKLFSECKKEYEALFRLMYNTAARVSAIENIRVSDISFEEKTLVIYEKKSHKENIIILAGSTIKSIKYYIEHYRKELDDSETDYLFVSRNSTKLSIRAIQRIVKSEALRILEKELTPHRFRDIAITHMLENNASVADVALIASHSNISTTMIYYEQSKKHREVTMKNSHPLLQIENIREEKKEIEREREENQKARKQLKNQYEILQDSMKKLGF